MAEKEEEEAEVGVDAVEEEIELFLGLLSAGGGFLSSLRSPILTDFFEWVVANGLIGLCDDPELVLFDFFINLLKTDFDSSTLVDVLEDVAVAVAVEADDEVEEDLFEAAAEAEDEVDFIGEADEVLSFFSDCEMVEELCENSELNNEDSEEDEDFLCLLKKVIEDETGEEEAHIFLEELSMVETGRCFLAFVFKFFLVLVVIVAAAAVLELVCEVVGVLTAELELEDELTIFGADTTGASKSLGEFVSETDLLLSTPSKDELTDNGENAPVIVVAEEGLSNVFLRRWINLDCVESDFVSSSFLYMLKFW